MIKFILLTTFFILLTSISYGNEILKPSIKLYETNLREIQTNYYKIIALDENGNELPSLVSTQQIREIGNYSSAILFLGFGISKIDLQNQYEIDFVKRFVQKQFLNNTNGFELFRVFNEPSNLEGTYIFNNNQICIGYYLIEQFDISKVKNTNKVQQIKSLALNNNYLSGQFSLPSGLQIDFYENYNQNFVERYGILKDSLGNEVLLLDAFYPQELEDNLKVYFINSLNNIKQNTISTEKSLWDD